LWPIDLDVDHMLGRCCHVEEFEGSECHLVHAMVRGYAERLRKLVNCNDRSRGSFCKAHRPENVGRRTVLYVQLSY
jgi:hypothetical protein